MMPTMKNTQLLRRIVRGVIAEQEMARRHMEKFRHSLDLSANAFSEFSNAAYKAGEATAKFAKTLKAKQ